MRGVAETRWAAQWSAKTVSQARRKLKSNTNADLTRTHTHRHMKSINIKNKQTKTWRDPRDGSTVLALAAAAEEPRSLVPSARMLAHSSP